jgi:hypothetical protein
MTQLRILIMGAALAGLAGPIQTLAQTEYLKKLPGDGEVPYGKVVYVDDGKCPKGEIKEVIGGSQAKSIPRQIRCVKRRDKGE